MKVVYIGSSDGLAEVLAERMSQEGNDIYILSDRELPRRPKGISLHRFYRNPRKGESFQKLLGSLSPDCVIFAGKHYIDSAGEQETEEDVTLLAWSLRAVSAVPGVKFILLSSTEVYGNTTEKAKESAECAAASERGMRFIREEQLLDIYKKQHCMDAVILRASQLYTDRPKEEDGDFLSRIFTAALQGNGRMTDCTLQPLNVSDLVDAVKRVIDNGKQAVYNVCGSAQVSSKRLYELICKIEKKDSGKVHWEESSESAIADSALIRKELGWKDIRNLGDQLQKGEIAFKRLPANGRNRKKLSVPAGIRQLIENLLIFSVFVVISYLCSSNSLFSQINWLMIYVILISITYNIYQSTLAAVLASTAYLVGHNMGILEMTTFYSYADSVLAVMEFVFLGLMVSYTTNMLREETRSVKQDLRMLREEYEDLQAINDENVLIKNEYEERLLSTKSGFPKLYGLVSRLMVQEPDRILMETMQVISELVRTDTVAVYQGRAGSPWLRLVEAVSDSSTMGGKTWNLLDSPKIYDAVARGELYQGEFGSGEPAIVLPIVCHGVPEAVVLIKTLPYECETLYHVNLLKTLSLLLRDSMEKALQYEELSRVDNYVKGTDILRPEAFRRRVSLAVEKAEKCVAEYCLIELIYSSSIEKAASAVENTLRVTDCLGTDGKGGLFVLLNNTGPGNLENIGKRLAACGVDVRQVMAEPVVA